MNRHKTLLPHTWRLAVLACMLCAANCAFAQPALQAHKSIRVRGTTLAYVDVGDGEPVILAHGFLQDYRVWSAQMPELSRKFRVIAYSMRSRWPNVPAGNDPSVTQTNDEADLVALIQALKLGRVHLVGHSGGANLALLVARDHPEVVRSLVLGEPGPNSLLDKNPEAKPLLTPAMVAEVRRAYEKGDREAALGILFRAIVGKDAEETRLPPFTKRMNLDNLWLMQRLWAQPDPDPEPPLTCAQAGKIQVPTLLLEGANTLRIFQLMVLELKKCMPQSERVVLPKATHALELENPTGFNQIVMGFLTKSDSHR